MKKNNYNECPNCFEILSIDNNVCSTCKEKQLVTYQNKKVIYKGRAYHKKKWLARLSVFEVENNQLKMRYFSPSLSARYVLKSYKQNIKSSTLIALILPILLFVLSGITAVISSIILRSELTYKNTSIFLMFLGLTFLGFALGLTLMLLVKKYYSILTINDSWQIQYRKVSKSEIIKKIEQLTKIDQKEEVII